MGRSEFLYSGFVSRLKYEPTPCQDSLLHSVADFICGDDSDIMVVNGYAGTGKTTAIAAVINTLREYRTPCILLAPTGRAAKVLSGYAGGQAYTIHKHIYRQKAVSGDGFGEFSLGPNKARDALFIVDEVSLIGIDAGQQSTSLFGSGNLLEDLIRFVRSGIDCRLILIGDSAQLPPVGLDCSPALSRDYMAMAGGVVYVDLVTVVRQQKESGILYNATLLRNMIEGCEEPGTSGEGLDFLAGEIELKFRTEGFDDVERIDGGDLIEKISDAYSRYGEDETIVLCRSNRRANKYNAGIRSAVQFKEDRLVRDDKLMIVKNCYQFVGKLDGMDYIANGDIAKLIRISGYEDRYGLHFAEARIAFPDYDDQEIVAKVILDTLESESASLTYEQQNALYQGVNEDYSHITSKKKRYEAVREDHYYNALQLKYANAITGHKSQGGQWKCVFIDNPLWQEELAADDLKWLYTAITRGVEKVYFVNFKDRYFE
ncbi:MAG: AAA family ATPase [Bacteroidales bacterium]|nr:AAA family ATPase [Bacteroidales bacterium]